MKLRDLFLIDESRLDGYKRSEVIEMVNSVNTLGDIIPIVNKISYFLSPVLLKKTWVSVDDFKLKVLKRVNKQFDKLDEKNNLFFDSIINQRDFNRIVITVQWNKSRTWGSNPTAESVVYYSDGGIERFKSTASGCGYDKLSTVVADVLNNSVRGLMCKYKELNLSQKNHELFGYGSGYGILPHLEGGVGCNCYNTILTKIGYSFQQIIDGDSLDVFEIKKI